jgi:hypothetical protein
MIHKPSIIITSLGRTGTLFFKVLYEQIFPDGTILHEPDYLNFGQYQGTTQKINQVRIQLREAGFSNLIIKKLLGRWSLVQLSHRGVSGKLSREQIAGEISKQRKKFINSQAGSIYVETSSAWFGVLDVLEDVFSTHRGVYILRNGVDWVRSKMNFGKIYDKGPLRSLVSYNWLTPSDLENDPYQARWDQMTRFEKVCWAWATLNKYAIKAVRENPHAILVKFEDIFRSEDRVKNLTRMVEFTTEISPGSRISSHLLSELLQNKIHPSSGDFPAWRDWSPVQKAQFQAHCGNLMDQYYSGPN